MLFRDTILAPGDVISWILYWVFLSDTIEFVLILTSEIQKGELMKKLVLVAVFLLGFSVIVMAEDTPKVEVFGGYSLVIVDTATALKGTAFDGMDLNLKGLDASIAINANKWVGFVADFGGNYGVVGYRA